jgi:hypothetical protein
MPFSLERMALLGPWGGTAFQRIQQALAERLLLTRPDFTLPFLLTSDASRLAVLSQQKKRSEKTQKRKDEKTREDETKKEQF